MALRSLIGNLNLLHAVLNGVTIEYEHSENEARGCGHIAHNVRWLGTQEPTCCTREYG